MATLPWLRACVKLRLALPGAASYGSRLQLAPPPSHATPPRRLACACPPPIAICRASCALCGHPVTGAGRALAPGRCGGADLASQRLAAGPAVGRSHTRSRPLALKRMCAVSDDFCSSTASGFLRARLSAVYRLPR